MVPTIEHAGDSLGSQGGILGSYEEAEDEAHRDWHTNSQKTRSDHLPQRALGHEIYASSIVGIFRIVHDAGMLAELAANFFDDGLCGCSDCLDGQ